MLSNEELFQNSHDNATLNRYKIILYLLSLNNDKEEKECLKYPMLSLIHGYDLVINNKLELYFKLKDSGFKASIDDRKESILIQGLDIMKNKVKYNRVVGDRVKSEEITLCKYMVYETETFLIAKSENKDKSFNEEEEYKKYLLQLKFNILLNVLSQLNDIRIIQSLYQVGVKNAEKVVTSEDTPIFKN